MTSFYFILAPSHHKKINLGMFGLSLQEKFNGDGIGN
jgi:hypothetical protein